jgi:hypothetical protein
MEDILRRIKELGELHKSGAISDDEFKALKKELLGSALESDITESDLSKEKHDPVKTQKETVVPHNSTTTASSSTFPVKKVILGAGLLLLLILAFKWIFPENEITQKIKETCSDCTEIEIPESDLILVTNSAGQSNIFSKSEMSYLLTEWYDIKFNEGLFFDDITFNIDGKSIMVSEHDYALISNDYLLGKITPTDNTEEEENKPSEWSCNICNKKFTHSGYEITEMGGCSQLKEPYQGFLCSCSCAREARRNFDKAVDDALNYNR